MSDATNDPASSPNKPPFTRKYLAETVSTLDQIILDFGIGPEAIERRGPVYRNWTSEDRRRPLDTAKLGQPGRVSMETYARLIYQRAVLLRGCAIEGIIPSEPSPYDPWWGLHQILMVRSGWEYLPGKMVVVASSLLRTDAHMPMVGRLMGMMAGDDGARYDRDGGPPHSSTHYMIRHFDGSQSDWSNCSIFPVPDPRDRAFSERIQAERHQRDRAGAPL